MLAVETCKPHRMAYGTIGRVCHEGSGGNIFCRTLNVACAILGHRLLDLTFALVLPSVDKVILPLIVWYFRVAFITLDNALLIILLECLWFFYESSR